MHVDAYKDLRGKIAIVALMDITTFQNVGRAIVILLEHDKTNATRMDFVSVIEMDDVFASNMWKVANVLLAKLVLLDYRKKIKFLAARLAFALEGQTFAESYKTMCGPNWVERNERNSLSGKMIHI